MLLPGDELIVKLAAQPLALGGWMYVQLRKLERVAEPVASLLG